MLSFSFSQVINIIELVFVDKCVYNSNKSRKQDSGVLCMYTFHTRERVIIIIIIISIFKEDNVFSITASLPYGPPVNTDIDYYRTFFGVFFFTFASVAWLVVRYFVRFTYFRC